MVQVRCPQCSSLVEGIEGQDAVCGHCGFRAQLPRQPARTLEEPPATARPAATQGVMSEPPPAPKTRSAPAPPVQLSGAGILAVWGYILGVAAIATFFLAGYGLPFAFGAAAIVLSYLAKQRDAADRRALIGMVLGGVGILAAIVWLLV